VFACGAHDDRLVDDPECRDVGPLDDAATAELADRKARWDDALAGKGRRLPLAGEEPTNRACALGLTP
jgi:hypothetical protein